MRQNQSAVAWLLPVGRSSSACAPSSPCQSCVIFMYLTLNRCNWLTSILSSTGALSLHRELEDNSLTVLVQMGPPLGINENSALSDDAFTDPFNQTSSLRWVIKAHCNSRDDLLRCCCCCCKRNSTADARKHECSSVSFVDDKRGLKMA